jgi:quinol monooxygenase YgiN
MVRVNIMLNVKSTRETEALMEALRFVVAETRQQHGCDDCSAWSDPHLTVRYLASWSSEAALRAHVRSALFTSLLAILESSGARPMLQFDFVSRSHGLDYVAAVRGEPVE